MRGDGADFTDLMEKVVIQQQRSLAETPTYSVASVVTVMIFVCFLVERSIYRFGKVSTDVAEA